MLASAGPTNLGMCNQGSLAWPVRCRALKKATLCHSMDQPCVSTTLAPECPSISCISSILTYSWRAGRDQMRGTQVRHHILGGLKWVLLSASQGAQTLQSRDLLWHKNV